MSLLANHHPFRQSLLASTIVTAGLLFTMTAMSAPVTFVFDGLIDAVPDPSSVLSPSIQVGSAFNGSYTLDPVGAGAPFDFPSGLHYPMPTGTPEISVTVEGENFMTPANGVIISNGRDWSSFGPEFGVGDGWLLVLQNQTIDGIKVLIVFFDSTGTKLTNEDLFVNDTLAGWDLAQLRIINTQDLMTTTLATGVVDTTPPGVPTTNLPLAYGLLLACLFLSIGLLALRRTG